MCVVVLLCSSHGAWGLIGGSEHDFSIYAWSKGEICLPCHTPHNADSSIAAPLWNHEMSTATYTLYSSPSMDVVVDQPGPASKVCLSCHDGTISLDSFGGMSGSVPIGGNANLGINLSDDHPVGIAWNHQTAGGACITCHPSVWVPPGVLVMTMPPTPMFNDKVECPSCHDPHNGFDLPHLVRDTMAGSQLCFNCHGDK